MMVDLFDGAGPQKRSVLVDTGATVNVLQSEMDELLKMGLVREEKSEWNCHSFYVNKHSERVRGKPRLVINYIPLNKVLKNISYLIPKPSDLMAKISKAKIFSK